MDDQYTEPEQITHPELVKALAKPGYAILSSLNFGNKNMAATKMSLVHMALGLSTEIAELFETHFSNNPALQTTVTDNLIEELGDLAWYLEGAKQDITTLCEVYVGAALDISENKFEAFREDTDADALRALAITVGNLVTFVKSYVIYEKQFDMPKAIELFNKVDAAFRVLAMHLNLGVSKIKEANITKLIKRYPNVAYSNTDAIERKDKGGLDEQES